MKRIYLMGLVLLVFTVLPASAVIFEDSFDSYPNGFPPPEPPWQRKIDPGVAVQIDESISYAGEKSCHFNDSGTGAGHLWHEFDAPISSELVLTYYMRTHNRNYEGAHVSFRIGTDGVVDWAASFGNGLAGNMAGWIGIIGGAGWIKPDLLEYSEDTWYYVERTINCDSGYGSFYVEELLSPLGDPANNNAFYEIGPAYSISSVDVVRMNTSNSQGADCYIDEIRVIPEPATLTLLGLGGLALIRRRRQ